MSRKTLFLIFLILLASVALSSTAGAASGLVGWWKLDEGGGTVARDSSGLGNDGTVAGATTWIAGRFGGALQLNGSGYVVIDKVRDDITSTDLTLSAWIRTTQSSEGNVFAFNDAASSHPLMFGVSGTTVFTNDGSDRMFQPPVNNNQWHMITFVRSGSNATIYLDGAQIGTYTSGFSLASVTRVSIGQEWDNASPSDFYNGAVDDIRIFNRPLIAAEVLALLKGGEGNAATSPDPADEATDVPRDAVLSWTASELAGTHDVYFGTVFTDVNTASRTSAKGVLAKQGQAGATYDPAGLFAYGQTYYWRVDEVNKTPDNTIFKGAAWSFTAEPYGYPMTPAKATASSAQPNMGPEKTIDGSGLTGDLHGTEPSTMWMSMGTQPNWIQYEFDKVYKLYRLQVWNSNQMIEAFMGFGAKTVTVETSLDGTTWTALANVPEFAKATGLADYAANTTVNFGGLEAQFVKLTISANWGGMAPQTGLAEVRFTYIPVQARAPQPAAAATGVSVDADLNWRPGREAASHNVVFGTDPNAVANGTVAAKSVTDHSFAPGILNLSTTYYWRVDEVNAVTYPGDVWSFTTEDYKVVEDFESYTDQAGEEVFSTWVDGYTDGLSGSTVGLLSAIGGTFCETTIVHGGKQSMPLAYDNTKAPNYSEATRTFAAPQDWTASGIKSLSLWFQGVAGNGGQLYVKINSTKVLYDGDAADVARAGWHVWNIDLSKAGKVNSVRTLVIGVEGAGAKGTLYIDDIRLYGKTPVYVNPVQPAATGLVGYYTFDEGSGTVAKDTSGKGNNGTINGSTSWVAGTKGGALMLGGTGYVVIDGVAKSIPADNNFTVSAWIKTKGTSGYVVASNDSASGHVFTIGPGSGGYLQVVANSSRTYPPAINDDEWHLITYVRDGTTASIYVDGMLVGTETPSGTPSTQTRWSIGQEWDDATPSDFYTGAVDDVRIYARPLSAEEVAGLFGLTKPMHKAF
jgi:hypothetical protein